MDKVFLMMREFLIELPNGVIFGLGRLEPVDEGWVVRIKDACDFEGEAGMIEAMKIAAQTTKTIAGYKDGEVEMWDVVEIFDNEPEATLAGKLNEQMTIYRIETATLKWLD